MNERAAYCVNCIITGVRLTQSDHKRSDRRQKELSREEKKMCDKEFSMANGKDSKFISNKNNLQIDQDDDVWIDESSKPLINGCEDNWTWSKRHRSQEAILPEPSLRKGTHRRSFSCGLEVNSLFTAHFSLFSSELE